MALFCLCVNILLHYYVKYFDLNTINKRIRLIIIITVIAGPAGAVFSVFSNNPRISFFSSPVCYRIETIQIAVKIRGQVGRRFVTETSRSSSGTWRTVVKLRGRENARKNGHWLAVLIRLLIRNEPITGNNKCKNGSRPRTCVRADHVFGRC